jgi:phosphoglycolate phosphatase
MLQKPDTLIWDWNGTLLDDAAICLNGINRLLHRRSLPLLDMDRYREIFTFPVRDYYLEAGFDFSREAFEVPAEEFIDEYRQLLSQAKLFPDVMQVLSFFRKKNTRQFILSAMEQEALETSVKQTGIRQFFEQLYGIGDNLASSKLLRGRELLADKGINPGNALMVGDTLHDMEVAQELGLGIVLIGRGHQHQGRLEGKGYPVLGDLRQLQLYFNSSDGK